MNTSTTKSQETSIDHLELMSALVDGELSEISDEALNSLLDSLTDSDHLKNFWLESHAIRDGLNEDNSDVAISNDFFNKFSQAFADEPVLSHENKSIGTNNKVLSFANAQEKQKAKLASKQSEMSTVSKKQPLWSLALAASVALMTISGLLFKPSEEATMPLPMTASNNNLQSIEQNMNHQLVSMTENLKEAKDAKENSKVKNNDVIQASSMYLPEDQNQQSFKKANLKDE